jgi:hypothetical protein
MSRKQISDALFALFDGLTGFRTMSQTLKHWHDISASQMPAFFLAKGDESPEQQAGLPARWYRDYAIYVYVSTEGEASPAAALEPLLDQIEARLAGAFPGRPLTLDGKVEWVRIAGKIETSEGALGTKEVARIPVQLLTV